MYFAQFYDPTRGEPPVVGSIVADLVRTSGLGMWPALLVTETESWEKLPDVLPETASGCYRELGPKRPAFGDGAVYLETFWTWHSASKAYFERAEAAGTKLRLLVERIGRLGPPPGGIALFELPDVALVEKLAGTTHDHSVHGGLYLRRM